MVISQWAGASVNTMAAFGSSIAGWFFPCVAEAANGVSRLRIPTGLEPLNDQERREVIRSAWLPAVVTIGLPLAFLSQAAFGWDGWWSVLVFVASLLVYSAISVGTVRWTAGHVLTTIGASFPLLWPALSILFILGWAPVLPTLVTTTPIVVVVAVMCWLLVIKAINYLQTVSQPI
jgi:hypothetical protein